ncbi:hypothetical protein [Roseovarius salis]|uniref:hypothetical protein n=1 Tax=Roseovarius salis TaxID=3376063 RepID=UPI0037C95F57
METQTFGSIVALQFRRRPGIEFADIVEEFDSAFQMVDARSRSLSWDCDDIAVIERDSVRVALGWLPPEDDTGRWHLIVAVGAVPGTDGEKIAPESFRYLADRIVERSRAFLPFTAVLHGNAQQPIGPALIDTTFDLLRLNTNHMPGDQRQSKKNMAFPENVEDYADMFSEMTPSGRAEERAEPGPLNQADTASKNTDRKHPIATAASGIAGHLEEMMKTRAEPTEPLRLTIHTVALSLLLTVPALGAFMFTYTMLRDMTQVAT